MKSIRCGISPWLSGIFCSTYDPTDARKALELENAGKYSPDAWRHSKNRNSKCWKWKNILWFISGNEIKFTFSIFSIKFVLYQIKIGNTIFLAMKINTFLPSTRQKLGNWKQKELKIEPSAQFEMPMPKKSFNILFFIVKRSRTKIALPSVLAVKVTKEISNRKSFNWQICSGRIDEI